MYRKGYQLKNFDISAMKGLTYCKCGTVVIYLKPESFAFIEYLRFAKLISSKFTSKKKVTISQNEIALICTYIPVSLVEERN